MPRIESLDQFAGDIDGAAHDPAVRYANQQPTLAATLKELRFHADTRYRQFTPRYGEDFEGRLIAWLNNTDLEPEEQVALLRAVPELTFIDQDDILSLCRTAFSDQVYRWLMDESGLDFRGSERDRRRRLQTALRHTWICSITDSLDIGQFYRVNKIPTRVHRVQWKTLNDFGDPAKISEYMQHKGIRRLLILEDVVGSGDQSYTVLEEITRQWVPNVPVLFSPLIVSESGLKRIRKLFEQYSHCVVCPTLVLPRAVHIRRRPVDDEPEFVRALRKVIVRTAHKFGENAFGYKGVGTLLVLHTNCPNNTPPIFRRHTAGWSALFPRVPRIGG